MMPWLSNHAGRACRIVMADPAILSMLTVRRPARQPPAEQRSPGSTPGRWPLRAPGPHGGPGRRWRRCGPRRTWPTTPSFAPRAGDAVHQPIPATRLDARIPGPPNWSCAADRPPGGPLAADQAPGPAPGQGSRWNVADVRLPALRTGGRSGVTTRRWPSLGPVTVLVATRQPQERALTWRDRDGPAHPRAGAQGGHRDRQLPGKIRVGVGGPAAPVTRVAAAREPGPGALPPGRCWRSSRPSRTRSRPARSGPPGHPPGPGTAHAPDPPPPAGAGLVDVWVHQDEIAALSRAG